MGRRPESCWFDEVRALVRGGLWVVGLVVLAVLALSPAADLVRRVPGGAAVGQAVSPFGAGGADFAAIHGRLVETLGVEEPALEDVTPKVLRLAFAAFAVDHSAASIARAWSTWNQFFAFLVAEDLVAGNPMGAVARPKAPRRAPKPLQGDDAPELLLQATAAGTRVARYPWPERDLAFLATSLLTGLRLSELLALNVGSVDGRAGERRIKVMGKGRKERTVPIEEPSPWRPHRPRPAAWRTCAAAHARPLPGTA